MTEAQLDELLDAVAAAVEAEPQPDLCNASALSATLHVANDNGREWPLLPFPEGWQSSC
jgi:hypothetical protein